MHNRRDSKSNSSKHISELKLNPMPIDNPEINQKHSIKDISNVEGKTFIYSN